MFVSHKISKSLDVFKNSDRCGMCGASAIATFKDGVNCGYCFECAPKRTAFVEEIVGNLEIIKYGYTSFEILSGMEMMRKLFFQERVYYLIDKYYGDDKDINNEFWGEHLDGYGELDFFDNHRFLEKVYDEKFSMMRNFINTIKLEITNAKTKNIKRSYEYYLKELEKMKENDIEKLDNIRNVKALLKTIKKVHE